MPGCVPCDRLFEALRSRHPDLWQTNPRLAERIEMRIKAVPHRHIDAHGGTIEASRYLSELPRCSSSDGERRVVDRTAWPTGFTCAECGHPVC